MYRQSVGQGPDGLACSLPAPAQQNAEERALIVSIGSERSECNRRHSFCLHAANLLQMFDVGREAVLNALISLTLP
jgi:hypothetical protein